MSHGVIRHGMEVNSAKYSFCSMELARSSELNGKHPPDQVLSQPALLIQLQEDRLTFERHIHPWIFAVLPVSHWAVGGCLSVLTPVLLLVSIPKRGSTGG